MKQLIPQVTLAHLTMAVVLSAVVLAQQQKDPCSTPMGFEYFIEDVMENTVVGTDLGEVPIHGNNSEVTLNQEPHSFLEFNPFTRVISLIQRLSVDNGSTEMQPLIIQCQTASRTLQIKVYITVIDYNNNVPTFGRTHHITSIFENAKIGDVVYSDAVATDNDMPYDRNSQILYSIVPGIYSDYFRVESGTSSVIILNKTLDFETIPQMIIEIKAMDRPPPTQPQLSSTATLTITILDSDDQNPAFSRLTYEGIISGDAEMFDMVSVEPPIYAEDQDTMKEPIIYGIIDPYNMFEIDHLTGEIWKSDQLLEGFRTHTIVVLATQRDNVHREAYAIVRITITEANIHAPKFDKTLYEVTKSEYEPVGSILVTASATDIDFGTILTYALEEDTDDLMVDNSGNIILLRPLDFEVEQKKIVRVTASDGSHAATATVNISIADVNDNNPFLTIPVPAVSVDREQGLLLTTVSATDGDVANVIIFALASHNNLFTINSDGEIFITAEEEDLQEDYYGLLVLALDDGEPPRQSAGLFTVNFPPTGVPPTEKTTVAVTPPSVAPDNMLTYILGAVAGVLFVIVVILIGCLIVKNRRTKEEMDKARPPHIHTAKGLTYRQADSPDDLPKMDLNYVGETDDSDFGGSTTIQENPFRAVNHGYLQSSGSEMDRDVGEIEIETAVVPYDEEDFGYPSGREPYMNGQQKTFKGGEDSTSTESSQSDSTGGSRRGLVNESKQNSNKMTSWDSDDKLHPQGAQTKKRQKKDSESSYKAMSECQKIPARSTAVVPVKLIDPGVLPQKTKKEKPEITVYF